MLQTNEKSFWFFFSFLQIGFHVGFEGELWFLQGRPTDGDERKLFLLSTKNLVDAPMFHLYSVKDCPVGQFSEQKMVVKSDRSCPEFSKLNRFWKARRPRSSVHLNEMHYHQKSKPLGSSSSNSDSKEKEEVKRDAIEKFKGMLWKTLRLDQFFPIQNDVCHHCWADPKTGSFESMHETKEQFHRMLVQAGTEAQFKRCLETQWMPNDYPCWALEGIMDFFSPLDMCLHPLLKIRFNHVWNS